MAKRLDGANVDADVIVVGAGVSGCACAAVLAEAGAQVLVVSSSLDVVGLPGYGPEVAAPPVGWERIEEIFSDLPAPLAVAWLEAASVSEGEHSFLIVDRRAVSIETKRLLELMPGLRFRQGLVIDIRASSTGDPQVDGADGAYVEVETSFGEVLRARAVVLAVGLGLGGVLRIGDQEMPGGRYGEVPADDLLKALTQGGASLQEVEVHVGARYGCRSAEAQAGARSEERVAPGSPGPEGTPDGYVREARPLGAAAPMLPLKDVVEHLRGRDSYRRGAGDPGAQDLNEETVSVKMARLLLQRSTSGNHDRAAEPELIGAWPEDAPPAPHKTERFVPSLAFIRSAEGCAGAHDESGPAGADPSAEADEGVSVVDSPGSVLLPDGAATLEFYESLGCADEALDDVGPDAPRGEGRMVRPLVSEREKAVASDPASRLGYVVRASVLSGLKEGRLPEMGPRVWATGRVAGAADYLDCLRAGLKTGALVLGQLEHPAVPASETGSRPGSGSESGSRAEGSTGKTWW